MKKNFNRILSFLLAAAVAFSTFCASPFFAEAKEHRVKLPNGKYKYVYTSDIAPSGFTAVWATSDSVKLSWYHSDYSGDYTGYQILSYNKSTKKYKHIAYTKKNAYVVKNLKPSKVYIFAVRSYTKAYKGKNLYGKKCKNISIATAPLSTKLKTLEYSKKGTLYAAWDKAANASGYVVQYSTSKKFKQIYTNTLFVSGKSHNHISIGGLAQEYYYVRVAPYKVSGSGKSVAAWSDSQWVYVSKGASLKQMINYYETDNSGRKEIYSLTDKGVDIKNYSTTYDKLKAIYEWHAKHGLEFAHCLACNANFNSCVNALFSGVRQYDNFIWIDAGDFQNRDGSLAMHKWSVLCFGGMPFIFDPRLQSYTGNYSGDLYFGVEYKSALWKRYLHDYWWGYWREGINHYWDIIQ